MIGLKTIEKQIKVKFSRNMLELNSIAAREDTHKKKCFFLCVSAPTVAKMNSFLFYVIEYIMFGGFPTPYHPGYVSLLSCLAILSMSIVNFLLV